MEELDPFRTDISNENDDFSSQLHTATITPSTNTHIPNHDAPDFHKELKKAELFIKIQERFIQKHQESIQKNETPDMASFIQELMAEHNIQMDSRSDQIKTQLTESIAGLELSTKSGAFESYIPTKVPFLGLSIQE